jgi:hypothetical protein
MAFGGTTTARKGGFAKAIAQLFEAIGILNKGSANAPAAPDASQAEGGEPVSTNALNVTRVAGIASLITGAGAAALAVFRVNAGKDPHGVVAAAYGSVGLIVATALIATAVIVAADIRARGAIAVAGTPATASVSAVTAVSGVETTQVTLDRAYELVLVNADQGEVRVTLPSAAANAWQTAVVKRTDSAADRRVFVSPIHERTDERIELTLGSRTARLYSDGEHWCVQ